MERQMSGMSRRTFGESSGAGLGEPRPRVLPKMDWPKQGSTADLAKSGQPSLYGQYSDDEDDAPPEQAHRVAFDSLKSKHRQSQSQLMGSSFGRMGGEASVRNTTAAPAPASVTMDQRTQKMLTNIVAGEQDQMDAIAEMKRNIMEDLSQVDDAVVKNDFEVELHSLLELESDMGVSGMKRRLTEYHYKVLQYIDQQNVNHAEATVMAVQMASTLKLALSNNLKGLKITMLLHFCYLSALTYRPVHIVWNDVLEEEVWMMYTIYFAPSFLLLGFGLIALSKSIYPFILALEVLSIFVWMSRLAAIGCLIIGYSDVSFEDPTLTTTILYLIELVFCTIETVYGTMILFKWKKAHFTAPAIDKPENEEMVAGDLKRMLSMSHSMARANMASGVGTGVSEPLSAGEDLGDTDNEVLPETIEPVKPSSMKKSTSKAKLTKKASALGANEDRHCSSCGEPVSAGLQVCAVCDEPVAA